MRFALNHSKAEASRKYGVHRKLVQELMCVCALPLRHAQLLGHAQLFEHLRYMLNELAQGRLRESKDTYAFILNVQKAYDTVWHNGLRFKLWEFGVRGKMWRVRRMCEASKSAVLLDGEQSEALDVEQGVAQGCSLSQFCFSFHQ